MLHTDWITEKDIAYIEKLEQETFSDAWSYQSLLETWMQPQVMMLGVWADDVFAGYVILYYVLDEGEIARIAVSESMRRQWVGTVLFRDLVKICCDKGITKILLDVRESNETAIAFYQSHGFVQDGKRKNFYTTPSEDAILMSLVVGR